MYESTYTTPRGGLTHDAKIELLDSRFAGLKEPEPEPSLGRVTDDALSRSGQRGDVRSSDLSKGELVQLAWSPPASSRLF